MCLVASSRVMRRVASKPLISGMTTSIRMRSGFSDFALSKASLAVSANMHRYPCFASIWKRTWRAVDESSVMRIFFTGIADGSPIFVVRFEAVAMISPPVVPFRKAVVLFPRDFAEHVQGDLIDVGVIAEAQQLGYAAGAVPDPVGSGRADRPPIGPGLGEFLHFESSRENRKGRQGIRVSKIFG